jgi:hypothetical protein
LLVIDDLTDFSDDQQFCCRIFCRGRFRLYFIGRVGDPCIVRADVISAERCVAMRHSKESVKFMQVLDRGIFLRLKDLSKRRGVTVQELIRVLVIPEWMKKFEEESTHVDSLRRQRRARAVRARTTAPTLKVRTAQRKV